MGEELALSIEELAERAGVSVRTVRYYISQGLLPGPGSRGKHASYHEDHLARLRLIRRLAERHVPLAEQRERLEQLPAEDLRRLLEEEDRHAEVLEQARSGPSPRDYVSRLLDHARSAPLAPAAMSEPMAARTRLRATLSAGRSSSESPSGSTSAEAVARTLPRPEQVQHVELVPGINLYVRADVAGRYPQLIERLLQAAHDVLGRGSP
jgi:DNA-binding transcriptional MerR regulator